MQMSPFAEQVPYQAQLPGDLRVGPQSHMSYPGGMSPISAQHRPVYTIRERGPATAKPTGALGVGVGIQ